MVQDIICQGTFTPMESDMDMLVTMYPVVTC